MQPEALILAEIYVASPLTRDEPLRMHLRHLNTLIQLGLQAPCGDQPDGKD